MMQYKTMIYFPTPTLSRQERGLLRQPPLRGDLLAEESRNLSGFDGDNRLPG
jgi:hypothetical protein